MWGLLGDHVRWILIDRAAWSAMESRAARRPVGSRTAAEPARAASCGAARLQAASETLRTLAVVALGGHADKGQPGDAKVRSRANRRNAPRASQPTGEEAVRLSRRASPHPPPALFRAHRCSMGAKLMHGGRRLPERAEDKANTLRERAQEAEDWASTNKASTHSIAAHAVVTLIEATGQSLICSRHRPGTCCYRPSSRMTRRSYSQRSLIHIHC